MDKTSGPTVHVILEQCSLETVKTRAGYELLNCDDHIGICKKHGRDPSEHRPDIVHQVLLALMDSPLNKAGHLHVLMVTKKNVLIEINPHTRIPRTFKRFCGLMVQLLHNLKVRAADSNDTLMRVLKSGVTQHIPLGCDVIGLEVDAELLDTYDLPARLGASAAAVGGGSSGSGSSSSSSSSSSSGAGGEGAGKKVGKKRPRAEAEGAAAVAVPAAAAAASAPKDVAVVIGAMSHGNITANYITRTFSLSRYPLSAACTVGKLMNAFERAWGVL